MSMITSILTPFSGFDELKKKVKKEEVPISRVS